MATPQMPKPMPSASSRGRSWSDPAHVNSELESGEVQGKPQPSLRFSNVVYIRAGLPKLEASPVVFVFLQQLVTEWQVRLY